MKPESSNILVNAKELPTIATERLSVRELRDADVPALFAIFSNPEVMRYWSILPLSDVEEACQMLADIRVQFQRKNFFKWGVARKDDDLVIGICTLFHVEFDHRRAEVGYALGRDHWSKGYMQETLRALLNFCFTELNLHRIEADVDPRNASSIKTLERLGFKREGYLRERWHVGEEIQDAFFYGLLRSDWQNIGAD